MPSTLTGRTRLAVLAVDIAVLIGGIVGLSTIGPSSSDVVADRGPFGVLAGGSTSITDGSDDGDDGSKASDTTSTTAPSRTGTSKKPAKSTDTTTGATGQPPSTDGLAGTREGTYESTVTEESGGWEDEEGDPEEPTTETEIVVVRTTARSATEVRQTHTTRDPSDEEDEGDEQEYRWTKDALFIVAPVDDPSECSAKELRWLKLPLAAGSTWTDRMECTYEGEPDEGEEAESFQVTLELTSRVTGSRQVQIAGRSLFVWEIEMEMRTTSGGEEFDSTLMRYTQFSPELGYEVRAVEEHSSGDGAEPGFSYSSTTELIKAPA